MQANEDKYTEEEQQQHQLYVVKAASSFSKALAKDGQVVQKLFNNIKKSNKGKPKIVDEQT